MATYDFSALTEFPVVQEIALRNLAYDIITPPPMSRSWSIIVDGAIYAHFGTSTPLSAPYTAVENDDPTALGNSGVQFSATNQIPTLYPHGDQPGVTKVSTFALCGDGGTPNAILIFDQER